MHSGRDFNEAPVQSCIGAMSSKKPQCAPAQGPCVQWCPCAIPHVGHKFKDALLCSRTGSMIAMRPMCAPAQGPGVL